MFPICREAEGVSMKNNTRFYIQPGSLGLSPQSTDLECIKSHMSSLCMCGLVTKELFVFSVYVAKCDLVVYYCSKADVLKLHLLLSVFAVSSTLSS